MQRLNLLRLTIRQNPIQKHQDTEGHSLCLSLAAQTVDAISAFSARCPSIAPCGFFFSTALLECIYHLIFAMRNTPTDDERGATVRSFRLAYRLLEKFSQVLDTAKRALRALNSVVSIASVSNSIPAVDERPNPEPEPESEHGHAMDLTFQTTTGIDFFDPLSWQIDDIPLDVAALVSSMGNESMGGADLNGPWEGTLDPQLCVWNTNSGVDPVLRHL
jgi:hypothetical protein